MYGQDLSLMESEPSSSPLDSSLESSWETDSVITVSGDDAAASVPELPQATEPGIIVIDSAASGTYGSYSPFAGFSFSMLLSVMVFAMVCGFCLSVFLNLIGWVIGLIREILAKGG